MPWRKGHPNANAYYAKWTRTKQQRWRQHGCCVACGLPVATISDRTGRPHARCFEHRLRASEGQQRWKRRKAQQVAS